MAYSPGTVLYDENGAAVTTLPDGFGGIGLDVAQMATGFVFSTVNSSTAQLASGAVFNGVGESVINQQSVSVLFIANQACTLVIRQWIDNGTTLASSWSYSIPANTGFSRAFTANGNYISFHVTNNGSAATTNLNLNVAYGTLPATTNLGNGPVSISEVNGYALAGDPLGSVPVLEPPTTMFYEDFTGALDTVNKWTLVGTAFSVSGGFMTFPTTAVSGSNTSIPTFSIQSSQHFAPAWIVRLEATAATGTGRFWGLGTAATTPAVNSLAQEGAGFQIDSTGAMQAVTYTGGVKTVVATLARPFDNAFHRYQLFFRQALTIWTMDGVEVARASNLIIATQTLSGHVSYFATGQTITGTPQTVMLAFGIGDRNRLHNYLADPTFPWRRAGVTDPAAITGAGTPGTGRTDQAFGASLNVNGNAIQKATYRVNVKPTASAATANVFQPRMALYHPNTAVKAVRIRKITVMGQNTAALAGLTLCEVHRLTATTPTGTAVTANATASTRPGGSYLTADPRDPAGEALVLIHGGTALAVTSAGMLASGMLAYSPTAAIHGGMVEVYNWQANDERKALTLRPGVLEGIALGINASAAMVWELTVEISYTEE